MALRLVYYRSKGCRQAVTVAATATRATTARRVNAKEIIGRGIEGSGLCHGERNGAGCGIGDPNSAQLMVTGEDARGTLTKHGAGRA